jgi:hypothetical protein
MKKIALLAMFAIAMIAVNAQTKATKENIVGKWNLKAMAMDTTLYYDIDTDSLVLPRDLRDGRKFGQPKIKPEMIPMVKHQFAEAIKGSFFIINADGTCVFKSAKEKDDKKTYTLDEASGTLQLKPEKIYKQGIGVSFKQNGRLVLVMPPGMLLFKATAELPEIRTTKQVYEFSKVE